MMVCDLDSGELGATVKVVEALGSDTYIYADMPAGDQIVIRTQSDTPVRRGETIGLRIQNGSEHLFEVNGQALAHADF